MDLNLIYEETYTLSGLIILAMVGGEALFSVLRKDKNYTGKDSWGNLTTVFGYIFLRKFIFAAIFAACLGFFERFALFSLSASSAWTWALAFLMADFFYYWDHRLGHEINALWAFHNIHHSSEKYNLTVASRLSWVEEIYRWIFLLPLILVGIPLPVVLLVKLLHRTYQGPVHTPYVGRLGWLEYILATPSQHRVHHGRNPQYLDKNYGGVLCVWDRLFGTFEAEGEPVEYGLVKQIDTVNPIKIQLIGPQRLLADLRQAKTLSGKLRLLVSKPGTSLEAIEKTSEGSAKPSPTPSKRNSA